MSSSLRGFPRTRPESRTQSATYGAREKSYAEFFPANLSHQVEHTLVYATISF